MYQKKLQGAVQVIDGSEPLSADHVDEVSGLFEACLTDEVSGLFEACLTDGQPMVVLDLEKVPLIDSAGLELLLDVQENYQQRGGALKLAAANHLCDDILTATGVGDRFETYQDVANAVGSFIR